MQAEIRKKAQEISYIATKLAELSTRQEIANKVEIACLNLIEKIYSQEYLFALEKTEVLEGLVAFSVNTGQTNIEHGEELIKRTASLKALLIEGYTNKEENRKLEAKLELLPPSAKIPSSEVGLPKMEKGGKGKIRQSGNIKLPDDNKKTGPKAEKRQARIVALLKEKGKLQLRDIVSAFPNTSERTIRYDLSTLCEYKKLIREGNGGPANFYMLPTGITTSTLEHPYKPETHSSYSSDRDNTANRPNMTDKINRIYPAPLPENAPVFEENTQETEQNFAKNELNEALRP